MTVTCRVTTVPNNSCRTETVHAHGRVSKASQDGGELQGQNIFRMQAQGGVASAEQGDRQLQGQSKTECMQIAGQQAQSWPA